MLSVGWDFMLNLLYAAQNAKFYMLYTSNIKNFKLNFIFNSSLGRAFYNHSDASYASLKVSKICKITNALEFYSSFYFWLICDHFWAHLPILVLQKLF
mgnify:CR=1 FL=1